MVRYVFFDSVVFNRGRGGRYWGWALNGNGRKALIELGEAVYSKAKGTIPAGGRVVYLDGDYSNCASLNIAVMVKGKLEPSTIEAPKKKKKTPAKKAEK